jgi:P pilus assembly chaperone PapD
VSRLAVPLALAAAALSLSGGASAGVALSVTPLRLALVAHSHGTIVVRNPSSRTVLVQASRAGFARSLRGRPRVLAHRRVAAWLGIRPRHLRLRPGGVAKLRVTATPARSAKAGDHPALVLLTTRPPGRRRVRVLLRIGVEVLVHVHGRTIRRVDLLGLAVRRSGSARLLDLRLVNRGNVTERLDGDSLRLVLTRHGHRLARLYAKPLELLPHSAGIVQFVYRGHARGTVRGRIELRRGLGGHGRTFRLRL